MHRNPVLIASSGSCGVATTELLEKNRSQRRRGHAANDTPPLLSQLTTKTVFHSSLRDEEIKHDS